MGNCSSPLRRHMRHDNVAGVQKVVEEAGEGSPDLINEDFSADCILDSCQKNQNTPLHSAMSLRQLEILEILLKYGGDPNTPSRYFGQTILHQAGRQNNLAAARLIIKYGADVYATDNEGRIPLHCAAGSLTGRVTCDIAVLQYLLEEVGKPGDIHVQDAYGNTPLHAAVTAEHVKSVNYLIRKGANMKVPNERGQTPRDLINASKGSFQRELDSSQKN